MVIGFKVSSLDVAPTYLATVVHAMVKEHETPNQSSLII